MNDKSEEIEDAAQFDTERDEHREEREERDEEGITEEQLIKDIKSHGAEYVAKYYGIPTDNKGDKALASAILAARKSKTPKMAQK